MAHYKHHAVFIATRRAKPDAEADILRHGYDVAGTWQQVHGRTASASAPVTHYMLALPADDGMLAAMRMVARQVPGASVSTVARGRRTPQRLRDQEDSILDKARLKKRPRQASRRR